MDIGANIGLHTALLSRLVGPHGAVHVFEPNAALLPGLRRTVRAIPNATLYPYALSDEKGPSTLFVSPDHLKTSLANWTNPTSDGVAQAASCERRRLDDLWGRAVVAAALHQVRCRGRRVASVPRSGVDPEPIRCAAGALRDERTYGQGLRPVGAGRDGVPRQSPAAGLPVLQCGRRRAPAGSTTPSTGATSWRYRRPRGTCLKLLAQPVSIPCTDD